MKTNVIYRSFVLATNATLKAEFKSINGSVKALVNMENLPEDVAKVLRICAKGNDAKPVAITSKAGRDNIARKVIAIAGERGTNYRKTTAKERANGITEERVLRETFSPYWVLQQLFTLTK